ncbi:MAG: ABC transporter ATP-binding protein [Acidimicrobiia bacterium]
MIRWDAVEVLYGSTKVLGPVSLQVEHGQWIGLIGPNGAGKSTLLKTALGAVDFEGSVVFSDPQRRRGLDIAWMPQRPLLPNEMTVTDYVLLGRTPHIGYLGSESGEDLEAVDLALAKLEMIPFAMRPLGTLSGGEAQKIVLARALAQEAPVLLLDEPTASLDIGHALDVLEVVDELRRAEALTVVTAVHDLTLAGRFADRLVLLGGGVIRGDGPPDEVLVEDLLRTHYGHNVRVIEDRDGPTVVPMRTR